MPFQFGIKDIIDILLVAIIMYECFRLLKRSGAVNLFWGILAFIVVWFIVSYVLNLELTGALFDRIISVGAIALIVIFQDQIRSFFYLLGSRFSDSAIYQKWRKKSNLQHNDKSIQQIMMACQHMSQSKTGALIVVARVQELSEYTITGERIDAIISARMIENIFFKNTPLHDGALIVSNNRLDSAACILPVSKNLNIPKHYGLRHRAALGLTEKTDAVAIIVSEETGNISIAIGETIEMVSQEELANLLRQALVV